MKKDKPILLVEDDEIDQMTVKRALNDIHITNRVNISCNGEEALEFLRDESNQKPGIILLDLNMPRMNGIEFLSIIKKDDKFKRIPVVVLTTSVEEQDKVTSYNLGVSGYMLKPVDYSQFVEVVRTIDLYWTLCEMCD